jgi:hypothetical protein
MHHTILAHAITYNPAEKASLLKALVAEADWGLGRNPLNLIQMTTNTTKLENKRSAVNIYTTGRNDGTSGMHPGHTPYMNVDDWGGSMIMGTPSWMYRQCYPAPSTPTGSNPWGPEIKKVWPQGELYFETRYVYAHSEFTPQQTMRGKMALYGYLHTLGKVTEPPTSVKHVNSPPEKSPEVSPNPTTGIVNVLFPGEQIKELTVFDMQMRMLKKQQVRSYNVQIDLSQLPRNIYFLKIATNNKMYMKQVILKK